MPYCDIILSSSTSARAVPAPRPSAASAVARIFQGFIGDSSSLWWTAVSRPHAVFRLGTDGGREPPGRRVDEAAEVGPRLARIDDLLHAEGLRGAEGRGMRAQARFDLGFARLGIGRGGDL